MTHHSAQDIAALASIPGLRVYLPSDRFLTQALMEVLVKDDDPAYIRVGRNAVEDVYGSVPENFQMDKALTVREGTDVTLIACGELVRPALDAAALLEEKGISARVIDMYCVKPLDKRGGAPGRPGDQGHCHRRGAQHIRRHGQHGQPGGGGEPSHPGEEPGSAGRACHRWKIGGGVRPLRPGRPGHRQGRGGAASLKTILAIDQSTSGTKALLFDGEGRLLGRHDLPHEQKINSQGWVSHDPMEIYRNTLETVRLLLEETGADRESIGAVGISNQRETALLWDRDTGLPVADAVVWQCARAAGICQRLADRGGGHPREDRPEPVPLLPGGQVGLDFGKHSWPRREEPVRRHHRCLAGVQAHRRQGVRHGLLQRLPHPAVQPADPFLGLGDLRLVRHQP